VRSKHLSALVAVVALCNATAADAQAKACTPAAPSTTKPVTIKPADESGLIVQSRASGPAGFCAVAKPDGSIEIPETCINGQKITLTPVAARSYAADYKVELECINNTYATKAVYPRVDRNTDFRSVKTPYSVPQSQIDKKTQVTR
jgi:proline racemase